MNWLDFLQAGCKTIEAPAAVPVFASVEVDINLIGTVADSIIANGTVTSNRVDYPGFDAPPLGPNTFALGRNECGDPGEVTMATNTPTDMGSGFQVGLATGPITVTENPAYNPGLLELYYGLTLYDLSAKVNVGGTIFQAFADPGFERGFTPSTWEEALGVIEVVFNTEPGSDPDGTITFTFTVG